VLVLLPPSEGKARPAAGDPVDLASLVHADRLTRTREAVLDKLTRVATGNPRLALRRLDLSPAQLGDVEQDAVLRSAPAAPAAEVYTGVLFERLRLPSLTPEQQAPVLIASALWGVVRAGDRIPAYRLSIGADLPRTPGLATFWKPALAKALPGEGLVVDARSGGYAAAWPATAGTVAIRAFGVAADGSRTVVSHMAKAVRGDVVRALLTQRPDARTPQDVLEVVTAAGMDAELVPAKRGHTLDVLDRAG
jgi:uncharacterized protein